ncbi:MAG: DUF6159 family protein [Candidatus Paceibacterota bacterium]|jgi:hypothetical protein|nr:DUF6159 family protein [Candidatus Paceibacterota bacterium]
MDKQEKMHLSEKSQGIFRESYHLAKKSFSLMRKDHHLILFPILSGVLTAVLLAGFFVLRHVFLGGGGRISPAAILLLWSIVVFLSTFMKLSVIACFRSYLSGNAISLHEAFRKSAMKIDLILSWTIISSFVGVFLLIMPSEIYTTVISGVLGIYWSLSTYFIIPAFSEDGATLSESFYHSLEALKRAWKEMMIINVGFEFLFAFAFILIAATLGDFLFLFPLISASAPFLSSVSFIIIVFLVFILIALFLFSILYRISFNLVLYLAAVPKPIKRISKKK